MLHQSNIMNLLSDDISYQSSNPLDSVLVCVWEVKHLKKSNYIILGRTSPDPLGQSQVPFINRWNFLICHGDSTEVIIRPLYGTLLTP